MQSLHPPYKPLDEEKSALWLTLLAPCHADCRPLEMSPMAAEQQRLLGNGVQLIPRSQRIFAPAQLKVLSISANRMDWKFALSKYLQMRLRIHTPADLPLANSHVVPGIVYPAGHKLFSLTAETLQAAPVISLHLIATHPALAIERFSGKVRALEDSIIVVKKLLSEDITYL